jgi:hypothetical protein
LAKIVRGEKQTYVKENTTTKKIKQNRHKQKQVNEPQKQSKIK